MRLDRMSEQYVKKWFGIPKHGANTALVHMSRGLNIQRISDVYRQAHSASYSRSRCKADNVTNLALDLKLNRESEWTRKISITKQCENIHSRAVGANVNPPWNSVQSDVKTILKEEVDDHWKSVVEPLLSQGDFARLLVTCETDLSWKSIMFSLPKGVLKFAINASIDSLPSFTNLKRWGKRLFDSCPLCNGKGTLLHILNNCQNMLDRYLWRHNNLIRIFLSVFQESRCFQNSSIQMYADIENYTIGGGTIPPNVIATSQKPDIVLYWPTDKRVILFELSVPFEPNINKAHCTKLDRYSSLVSDIIDAGFDCSLVAIEIGSRGLIDTDNKNRLTRLSKDIQLPIKFSEFKTKLVKSVIMSSYSVYNARHEPSWNVNEII